MSDKIVLPSTQNGYLSRYFWSCVWLALLLAGTWYAEYVANYPGRYYDDVEYVFAKLGKYLAFGVGGVVWLTILHNMAYGAREVNTFFKNASGYVNRLTREAYGFPLSKTTQDVVFDRITDIAVEQSAIGFLTNTGTLAVKLVTFTNADSKEQTRWIPAIKDPHQRKAELQEALLCHDGLEATVKQMPSAR